MRSAMTVYFFVSLLSARVVAAREERSYATTLDGVVKTVQGARPAGFVHVRLQRLGMTIQDQFSNDGRFTFRNIAPGPYTLVVECLDYETASAAVEIPGESFVTIAIKPVGDARPGKPETRSLLMYLFEADRLDEAERLGRKMHSTGKHSPEVHLVLGKIYAREQKKQQMVRELELYVKEAPDGPLRRQAQQVLTGP